MLNRFAKTLLVCSAIAPVALIYAWVLVSEDKYALSAALILVCAALVSSAAFLLNFAQRKLQRFPLQFETVEPADRENVAFLLLYLSPLFTSQMGLVNLNVVLPTVFTFALLSATGYNYHFNPLLGLLGWHFYKISSTEGVTYVLITKKQIRQATQIESVGQLTEYILIDFGDRNAS